MTSRGLTAGSFGIFEIQGGGQSFVVGGDRLLVLFQALDIATNRVLRHLFGFAQCASRLDASGQRWNNRRKAALWFRAQEDVEAEVSLLHVNWNDAMGTADESIFAPS